MEGSKEGDSKLGDIDSDSKLRDVEDEAESTHDDHGSKLKEGDDEEDGKTSGAAEDVGEIMTASNPRAQAIMDGFRV